MAVVGSRESPHATRYHDREVRLIQTLIKNWWLLALCGVLDAIYSVTNLLMQGPDGSLIFREFMGDGTVRYMGKLALAAGVCTIAAGMWHSRRGKSWLLALNGFALGAFGLFCVFWIPRGRVSFLPFAILFVVMAVSIGIFALGTARTLRRHVPEKWFLGLAGVASMGFALTFCAVGFRWIRLQPLQYVLWMSSYFGFSAICMLGLGLWLNSLRGAIHRMASSALASR